MTMLTLDTKTFIAAAPKGLRAEAAGMTPAEFYDSYCGHTGPVRLSEFAGGHRNAECTATLEFADHLRTVATTGSPVAALTSALYEEGYPVEILQFHQRRTAGGTATFVRCELDGKRGWGAAVADDGAESIVRAMISGINRLGS
ncbi:LeuA allosteric (dimerisation) domain-containing protein [Nocardia amikacinitolerans]|uniref:LeuA allosteric (Dimerisation) domain-containing protein n=2 Tax=Nocardia amikacinitolerans TaxID=756689 RepID=A0A285LY21_9NOCA|nr:LeuA allosteric (dimerization) domain-containing protein [Nocardia amikacinitolerans]MCP2299293.1 LeuA allosteric (dimerization) domain-containing protein [Nocardia amikacinitolerans]MCP2319819.1 LeuA allosteric (dimerization) domain-containing protein [Nocardia amikacinitolerans]SNY89755.1 LeuA allosteric (dimerisation) domain-containing protein [Nocardia amikacinitolerans]